MPAGNRQQKPAEEAEDTRSAGKRYNGWLARRQVGDNGLADILNREPPEPHRWSLADQPLVIVAASMAIGILTSHYLLHQTTAGICFLVVIIAAAIGWLAMRAKAKLSRQSYLLLMIAACAGGAARHHVYWNWYGENDISQYATGDDSPSTLEAIVVSEPRQLPPPPVDPLLDSVEALPRVRITLRSVAVRDGDTWHDATGTLDLTIHDCDLKEPQAIALRAGDRIRVSGNLNLFRSPGNPGQYNFHDHYRSHRRLASLHCDDDTSLEIVEAASGWGMIRSRIRSRLAGSLDRHLAPRQAAFAGAILLGNREELPLEFREQFLVTGTAHLLAISGLHVGILAGSLLLLLRFGFVNRKTCLIMVIAFLAGYCWLVEFRPTVVRASILIAVFCVARMRGQQVLSFETLAAAGIVVLLVNPMDLISVGPQLSFLAIATLTVFGDFLFRPPPADSLDQIVAKSRPWPQRLLARGYAYARTLVLVSAVIWVTGLPLVAMRFHLITPVALLINPLLMLPIATALYLAMATCLLDLFFPSAASMTGWLCQENLALIESMIQSAEQVPGGHFWTAGPAAWAVLLFYAGFLLIACFNVTTPRFRFVLAGGIVWIVGAWMIPDRIADWQRTESASLVATVIDVGHGSSVLIECPDGQRFMYDGGSMAGSRYAASCISHALWSRRIGHLDAVIISHADVDHFNAIPTLSQRFSIGVVYLTPMMASSDSPAVDRLVEELGNQSVPIRMIGGGSQFSSGAAATAMAIELMGPAEQGTAPRNDNADSAIVSIEYAGRKILLPGDVEDHGLNNLLQRTGYDCDILMAAHHGSPHSLPREFTRWCRPEHVAISCGDGKVDGATQAAYGLGHQCQVLRTDVDGAIRYEITKTGEIECHHFDGRAWVRQSHDPTVNHLAAQDVRPAP